jgi:hypothetical protein
LLKNSHPDLLTILDRYHTMCESNISDQVLFADGSRNAERMRRWVMEKSRFKTPPVVASSTQTSHSQPGSLSIEDATTWAAVSLTARRSLEK